MWKKTGLLAGIVFGAAVLGACGGTGKAQETTQAELQKLTIWSYYETEAQRDGLDRLTRDFNQSQNVYEISWKYVPMTGFEKGLSSAYTENDLPDLVILDNPDMLSFIQAGLFEDITDQAKEWNLDGEYYPAMVGTLKYEDRYYGLPFNCNSTALIYDKKVFEEAGISSVGSWEELRAAAKKLTTEERSGFVMCAIKGEQGAFQLLSWILAAGEDPGQLGGTATEEALEFLDSMIEDGSLSKNCVNYTQTDLAEEFIAGRAAIMQNGPWVFPALDEAGIEYGILPIPGKVSGAAVLGGENICVLKGKNTEGALKFLQFCMEGEEIETFCRTASVLPAKISSAEAMARQDDRMAVFEAQMENIVSRNAIDAWPSVMEKLTDGMYSLMAGEETPAQTAASLRVS